MIDLVCLIIAQQSREIDHDYGKQEYHRGQDAAKGEQDHN